MIEKALEGSKKYWSWVFFLLLVIGIGSMFYVKQLFEGLGITGLSRDVSWGFYIAQLTFLVGVAASAVMLVLPYYLHDQKAYGKMVILGEFLAVASVVMCLLFVLVDLGRVDRMMNIFLHPTPNSILFWDAMVLQGYLLLNLVIGFVTFDAEKKGIPAPKWIKPLIILSIPWAVSIHTVTAFLYAGIPGRSFWLTAVLAPRFLASAFAGGPALLIILAMVLRKVSSFDAGEKAIKTLGKTVAYAMCINIFLLLMEVFTAFYSQIPEHTHHFHFLYAGLHGQTQLVPWMWTSAVLAIISIVLLVVPKYRENNSMLVVACIMVFVSIWIDKGMGLIIGGFTPNPFDKVTFYMPTVPEVFITIGVYGIGALILTLLYKMVLTVRGHIKPVSNIMD
jgi:molybdopterin-containing oxidoreductase family membrane subunit